MTETRFAYSEKRIQEVKELLSTKTSLSQQNGICVYVTGSLARGEAHRFSDLDIFFLEPGGQQKMSDIAFTLIKADLIRSAEQLNFPPFSQDGNFLHLHSLDNILSNLGSPKDDYSNCFTARMLLLLESRCLHNELLYNNSLKDLIKAYRRDYHEHRHDFMPIFLINDIQRYWRTMCLNYEHKRNRPNNDPTSRAKNHIKNFKLKFSRMLTCFSGILALSSGNKTEDEMLSLLQVKPLTRLKQLDCDKLTIAPLVQTALIEYEYFLEKVAIGEEELLRWISSKENRVEAFSHADRFADAMYNLIQEAVVDLKVKRCLLI